MSGYPLRSLHPDHLEKVISKMKLRSYFRLQQTCKDLEQFIRNSKKIVIPLDIAVTCEVLQTKRQNWKAIWRVTDNNHSETKFKIPREGVSGLRGIRVGLLDISAGFLRNRNASAKLFEGICNYIKDLRISCTELWTLASMWTSEQTLAFMEILKPTKITMFSQNSNRYEAILQSKTVKEVSRLIIDELAADIATEKLLSKFGNMMIAIARRPTTDPFPVIRRVLHILFSRTWLNVQKYELCIMVEDRVPFSEEELEDELRDFKLVIETEGREDPFTNIELPRNYPQGSECCLKIERVTAPGWTIFYRLTLAAKIPPI